jgi:hypothetical protein
MTQEKATATWADKVPTNADAGDAYYFVRRKDKLDVVIMGFSMGKGWLNGVSYDASEMRNHLFLGPVTPELFNERDALLSEVAQLKILYDRIFRIRATGDRGKPVQGVIDYEAKAAFEIALESLGKER